MLLKLEERAAQTDDKQLDLFVASEASSTVFPEEELPEEDPTLLELRDQLADVSMDDLSPRQAWELLADLQKKAKENEIVFFLSFNANARPFVEPFALFDSFGVIRCFGFRCKALL